MNEELRATAALLKAAVVSELAACGLRREDAQLDGVEVEKHQKRLRPDQRGHVCIPCYRPRLRGLSPHHQAKEFGAMIKKASLIIDWEQMHIPEVLRSASNL